MFVLCSVCIIIVNVCKSETLVDVFIFASKVLPYIIPPWALFQTVFDRDAVFQIRNSCHLLQENSGKQMKGGFALWLQNEANKGNRILAEMNKL